MKKFGFFLFAVLGLIACGDDNNDPTPEQHVTCSISAPAEGATVNIAEKMTIKGEATIDFGEISNVTLKVGDKAISEVTAVPFSYDYTFEANQAEGALKIELTVKGDQGTTATSEVNVTLQKTKPTPEPEEGKMIDHETIMNTKLLRLVNKYGWQRTWPIYHQLANRKLPLLVMEIHSILFSTMMAKM